MKRGNTCFRACFEIFLSEVAVVAVVGLDKRKAKAVLQTFVRSTKQFALAHHANANVNGKEPSTFNETCVTTAPKEGTVTE